VADHFDALGAGLTMKNGQIYFGGIRL